MQRVGPLFKSAAGRLSAEDGLAARERRPLANLADLVVAADRDPIALTSADDALRVPGLLSERYLRMSASCFAFYRGSAAVMAHDLGAMPDSGVITQLCGDAHVSNFGAFASPERELVFDVNDFDETAAGPFEWDVLRLAASVVLAARDLGVPAGDQRKFARRAVKGYQKAIVELAGKGELDVWYEQVPVKWLLEQASAGVRKRSAKLEKKARSRDGASAVRKLTETVDGELRFREEPPLLVRLADIDHELAASTLASYVTTLPPDRQHLLGRYRLVDVAFKAVGVGSVGTRCLIALMAGLDHGEPLILQLKEAGPSALERYVLPAEAQHHGARVVNGQRLMQAASDIFLGWTTGADGHHFYWRQLRDMKFSPDLATMQPDGLEFYGQMCGRVLARAHARGGNRAAIAAYVGEGRDFPDAAAQFAERYADQAEADYALLVHALAEGRLAT